MVTHSNTSSNHDPRVDKYIAESADFARPILQHLRQLVHRACPEVQETWKWSFPHFVHHGTLCSMAAFKAHCTFGFWKAELILPKVKGLTCKPDHAMGQFGRITALTDLPPDRLLIACIQEAARLNVAGVKKPSKPKPAKQPPLVVPKDLSAALNKNKKAEATFDGFAYSHKKEYVEWIAEAKREDTRQKRLAQTIQWLAQGKSRNWKYC